MSAGSTICTAFRRSAVSPRLRGKAAGEATNALAGDSNKMTSGVTVGNVIVIAPQTRRSRSRSVWQQANYHQPFEATAGARAEEQCHGINTPREATCTVSEAHAARAAAHTLRGRADHRTHWIQYGTALLVTRPFLRRARVARFTPSLCWHLCVSLAFYLQLFLSHPRRPHRRSCF